MPDKDIGIIASLQSCEHSLFRHGPEHTLTSTGGVPGQAEGGRRKPAVRGTYSMSGRLHVTRRCCTPSPHHSEHTPHSPSLHLYIQKQNTGMWSQSTEKS